MATHRLAFGALLMPDASNNVGWQESSINDVNDLAPTLPVLVFKNTATRDNAYARFNIPKNFVSAPKIVLRYKTSVTSGDALWAADVRCIADGEDGDPSSWQESVAGTAAAVPGTARREKEVTLAFTASNFAPDDDTLVRIGRNGAGADTAAGDLELLDAYFEYSDT